MNSKALLLYHKDIKKRFYFWGKNAKYFKKNNVHTTFTVTNLYSIDPTNIKIDPKDIQSLGVRYLDHLEYAFPESKLPPITEKNPRPEYNPLSYIDDIKNKRTAPVYIKYINAKCGYGVFAEQDIPQGHIIAEYTGIVRRKDFS